MYVHVVAYVYITGLKYDFIASEFINLFTFQDGLRENKFTGVNYCLRVDVHVRSFTVGT